MLTLALTYNGDMRTNKKPTHKQKDTEIQDRAYAETTSNSVPRSLGRLCSFEYVEVDSFIDCCFFCSIAMTKNSHCHGAQ